MLPKVIENKILEILSAQLKRELRIFDIQSISGGSINMAVKVSTKAGNFFVKWNDAHKYPDMFKKETRGLKLLESTGALKIPKVIGKDEVGEHAFLILEFLDQGNIHADFWNRFGSSLAKIHQNTHTLFGLDHDNYIGSLYQSNKQHENWISFFSEERIQPQLKLAYDSNLLDNTILKAAERLFKILNGIIPIGSPALLHGDLWSGNFMIDSGGNPVLIDPAVYYGHREMDLAMTRLFGGFDQAFYEAYHKNFPLEKGWEKRLEIYNLYPLLVHVNLFGGNYISQVASILSRF